jgi:hypothetical protein
MSMRQMILIMPLLLATISCDSKDSESAGYQDGYAATINTSCNIRGTLIAGNFNQPAYARGYSKGSNAASLEIGRRGCAAIRSSYGIRN